MSTATASLDGRFDVMAAACPTRQMVNRLGEKWVPLVLYALGERAYRFRELQRAVEGISQRMLTQTLRDLERDGLVHREVRPTVPPQVEYSLTELGVSFGGTIAAIRTWAYAHMDQIQVARLAYDQRAATSAPTEGA